MSTPVIASAEQIAIKIVSEYELTKADCTALQSLLQASFPGYPTDRTYYNQLPSSRTLVYHGDTLIGQAGLHHRMIRIGARNPVAIFGISDFCIDPTYQLQHVGSKMMESIEAAAHAAGVDFLILSSQADEFYMKQGFVVANNPCRWLMIQGHESMGVLKRTLHNGILVKGIKARNWAEGEVDFMGHMF